MGWVASHGTYGVPVEGLGRFLCPEQELAAFGADAARDHGGGRPTSAAITVTPTITIATRTST